MRFSFYHFNMLNQIITMTSTLISPFYISDERSIVFEVLMCFFAGSDAEQKGLKSGDEVLQIQDSSLQGLTRFEAWTFIKGLDEGPFTLIIKKKRCEQS